MSDVAVRQGPCFRYALPAGWQVVEDGQFAVVLMAPDQRAVTTVVGNAGMPVQYPPHQFVWEKLGQAGLSDVRLGPPQPAPPAFGAPYAWEFDVDYTVRGIPCCGLARCTVAPAYDSCTMILVWAASEAVQWPRYASWLPGIAAQIEAVHPAAFGSAGIASQNARNAAELGDHARRNRERSQHQWADVTRERQATQDRVADGFRQALDGVRRYDDPHTGQPIDLPTTHAVYWIHPITGQIVGDPNPSYDPRTPIDTAWQPLKPSR